MQNIRKASASGALDLRAWVLLVVFSVSVGWSSGSWGWGGPGQIYDEWEGGYVYTTKVDCFSIGELFINAYNNAYLGTRVYSWTGQCGGNIAWAFDPTGRNWMSLGVRYGGGPLTWETHYYHVTQLPGVPDVNEDIVAETVGQILILVGCALMFGLGWIGGK